MAALFIGVTMAFPMGLAGLWESHVVPWWKRLRAGKAPPAPAVAPGAAIPVASAPDTSPLPGGISGQQA